jgi:hypothetical protein
VEEDEVRGSKFNQSSNFNLSIPNVALVEFHYSILDIGVCSGFLQAKVTRTIYFENFVILFAFFFV